MGGRTLHLRESLDILRLIVFRQLGHTLDFDWAKKCTWLPRSDPTVRFLIITRFLSHFDMPTNNLTRGFRLAQHAL